MERPESRSKNFEFPKGEKIFYRGDTWINLGPSNKNPNAIVLSRTEANGNTTKRLLELDQILHVKDSALGKWIVEKP